MRKKRNWRNVRIIKEKRKINYILWLKVLIPIFFMLIGIVGGIGIGIKVGQMMLFEGMGIALADTNINITIDINETKIIEGARKIAEEVLVPVLNQSINKEEKKR